MTITPRLIRLRDAPAYLGMDKNRFNHEVRPLFIAIPIGAHGIAFDRIDLDQWADDHKSRNGRLAASSERSKPWETERRQVSPSVVVSGISTRSSEEQEFAKALEQVRSVKPKRS